MHNSIYAFSLILLATACGGTPFAVPGDAGPQGPQGEEGPTGATGPRGAQGPQGQPGVTEVEVITADGGTATLDAASLQGPPGPAGPAGPQGPAGVITKAMVYTVTSSPTTCGAAQDCVVKATCSTDTDVLLHGFCTIVNNTQQYPAYGVPQDNPVGQASEYTCTITSQLVVQGMGLLASATCAKSQ